MNYLQVMILIVVVIAVTNCILHTLFCYGIGKLPRFCRIQGQAIELSRDIDGIPEMSEYKCIEKILETVTILAIVSPMEFSNYRKEFWGEAFQERLSKEIEQAPQNVLDCVNRQSVILSKIHAVNHPVLHFLGKAQSSSYG